jgi:hypothetical protein
MYSGYMRKTMTKQIVCPVKDSKHRRWRNLYTEQFNNLRSTRDIRFVKEMRICETWGK